MFGNHIDYGAIKVNGDRSGTVAFGAVALLLVSVGPSGAFTKGQTFSERGAIQCHCDAKVAETGKHTRKHYPLRGE